MYSFGIIGCPKCKSTFHGHKTFLHTGVHSGHGKESKTFNLIFQPASRSLSHTKTRKTVAYASGVAGFFEEMEKASSVENECYARDHTPVWVRSYD